MKRIHIEPQTLYHGAGVDFVALDAEKGVHVGSRAQAEARRIGKMLECKVGSMTVVRRKDSGGDWPRKIRGLRAKGIDGVVYLNRYEGVPLNRTLLLMARGMDREQLGKLSDVEFQKLVPEAHDSYLVLNHTVITTTTFI